MSHERTDKLIWVLLFGGLIFVGLGFSAARTDEALGWALGALGVLDIVIGAALLWLRARQRSKTGH